MPEVHQQGIKALDNFFDKNSAETQENIKLFGT
jgi:hypothetical protein